MVSDRAPFGVIAAMPGEARACRLGTARFMIRCAGPGPQAATDAAHALLAAGARVLWSWGTAGALEPTLRPGTLVVLTHILSLQGIRHAAHPALTARLAHLLIPHGALAGGGLSSPQAVATRETKRTLGRQAGVATVDMETFAIAAVAQAAGAHFVALRAVVDPAEFTLPTSALAALAAPAHPLRATVTALLRRPQELPDFVRLAGWYHAALACLCHTSIIIDAEEWPLPGDASWQQDEARKHR
jgi:nucleoside phosphorylase